MSYFDGDRDAAIAQALELVKTGLQSGAITLCDGHNYAEEGLGKAAGAAIGAMISELTERLLKL